MLTRYNQGETILGSWACDGITTATAKALLNSIGYDVDFRQPDNPWIEATDLEDDSYVEFDI